MLAFFTVLRAELGFLVGCLNLHEALQGPAAPVCMPDPVEDAEPRVLGDRPLRSRPSPHDRWSRRRQRRGGGRRADRRDHRCQRRRQVDLPPRGRPGPRDAPRRNVRRGGAFLGEPSIERPHALHARGGRRDGARQAPRGARSTPARSSTHAPRTASCCSTSRSRRPTSARAPRSPARSSRRSPTVGVTVWFVTHNHQFAADLHRAGRPGVRFLRAERGDGAERSFRITESPPLSDEPRHGPVQPDRRRNTGASMTGRAMRACRPRRSDRT